MSSAARSLEAVRYLPIDGLIASLEDALAEIAEIESRRSGGGCDREFKYVCPAAGTVVQHDRMRLCRAAVVEALAAACAYAKGPRS